MSYALNSFDSHWMIEWGPVFGLYYEVVPDECVSSSQIGVAFYEMLQAVDQHIKHLSYMDPICDFLYHIKYMFTGDSVKDQVTHTHSNILLCIKVITSIGPTWPAWNHQLATNSPKCKAVTNYHEIVLDSLSVCDYWGRVVPVCILWPSHMVCCHSDECVQWQEVESLSEAAVCLFLPWGKTGKVTYISSVSAVTGNKDQSPVCLGFIIWTSAFTHTHILRCLFVELLRAVTRFWIKSTLKLCRKWRNIH